MSDAIAKHQNADVGRIVGGAAVNGDSRKEGEGAVAWVWEGADGRGGWHVETSAYKPNEPHGDSIRNVRPLYAHPSPAVVGEGWKLVPVEPTEEMIAAWRNVFQPWLTDAYRAMIAAAPSVDKA